MKNDKSYNHFTLNKVQKLHKTVECHLGLGFKNLRSCYDSLHFESDSYYTNVMPIFEQIYFVKLGSKITIIYSI